MLSINILCKASSLYFMNLTCITTKSKTTKMRKRLFIISVNFIFVKISKEKPKKKYSIQTKKQSKVQFILFRLQSNQCKFIRHMNCNKMKSMNFHQVLLQVERKRQILRTYLVHEWDKSHLDKHSHNYLLEILYHRKKVQVIFLKERLVKF